MDNLKIGQLIDADQQRDAIHVAVAPVIASERLEPGRRVRFVADSTDRVEGTDAGIGIIDPFLILPVEKGQRCWMFLNPGTITSLRHDWTHPAFQAKGEVAESKAWIEAFAAELDQTYNRLMEAAQIYAESTGWREHTYDNSERYKEVDYAKWPEFWKHYAVVTGKTVDDDAKEGCPYTCSC